MVQRAKKEDFWPSFMTFMTFMNLMKAKKNEKLRTATQNNKNDMS